MARDIAQKFNTQYNQEIFVLPQAKIDESKADIRLKLKKMENSCYLYFH